MSRTDGANSSHFLISLNNVGNIFQCKEIAFRSFFHTFLTKYSPHYNVHGTENLARFNRPSLPVEQLRYDAAERPLSWAGAKVRQNYLKCTYAFYYLQIILHVHFPSFYFMPQIFYVLFLPSHSSIHSYQGTEKTAKSSFLPQCARTDLNKRFLPKPMTTTG